KTKNNTPFKLLFPINYPPPAQLLQTIKSIYHQLQPNPQNTHHIHQFIISKHLITHPYPHPHLLIPTSPEQPLTNFLISH
ncbi:undecaprenyl diphosphate synthase family protein, partial [Staphylococcus hominis]|uniref:undecaprenyl diphosphate synthase family protein n=1 Tax=Staphylococcus hominis TaxID=1290 RepID=UPI001643CF3A